MHSFDDLVAEAVGVDVTGWGFDWLDGRATEERPPWSYVKLIEAALAASDSALDIDTGGGEVIDEAGDLPSRWSSPRPGRPMRSGHVIGWGRVVPSSCSHGSWSELTQDEPNHVIDETREWIEPHGFWCWSTRCLEHASVCRAECWR
ncbi:hypothetical protein [Janibacter sp. YB324]|uniref:hypothetical protein n=1 Tax=Janibacter TaxID=53457 RepID=UPI0016287B39|nr:hypothetical protein [Janibacter sp. YB324]QNF95634.1 hypothetical protein H7A72_07885 [Janibacter sp. YB324]